MRFDPEKHHRRSIRWRGYDYRSTGAYFVTICTHDRVCLLDDPALRQIIQATWEALPGRFPSVVLDEFVIMPNHVHFIVWIGDDGAGAGGAGASPAPMGGKFGAGVGPALGDVVGTFKSLCARGWLGWIRAHAPLRSARLWHRNYYERVIRNEVELNRVRQYIRDNPARWPNDRENPD